MDDCVHGTPGRGGGRRKASCSADTTFVTNPPLRNQPISRLEPKSNVKLSRQIDTLSLRRFSRRLRHVSFAGDRRRGRWRFQGEFRGGRGRWFGNEQSRRPSPESVSFDRSWRESKGGFWLLEGCNRKHLVTTSVLHKYFNRRLFHVLPIPTVTSANLMKYVPEYGYDIFKSFNRLNAVQALFNPFAAISRAEKFRGSTFDFKSVFLRSLGLSSFSRVVYQGSVLLT